MTLSASPEPIKRAIARIRHANGSVVGAGFLVSESCLLTCAHVITEALGISQTTAEAPTALVELNFPFAANSPSLKAQVIFWRPVNPGNRGEDIAGLQIVGPLPQGLQPLLLMSSDWWKHPFGAFGFPQSHDSGVWASGDLKEQRGDDGWVQIEGLRAEGYSVLPGFSGAPVWDETVGGAVGMMVAAERKRAEARVAYMIPTEILSDAVTALTLIAILLPHYDANRSQIQAAFKACRPAAWSDSMPATLAGLIAELQEMPQGEAPCSRLLQFVVQLAATMPSLTSQLAKWVESQGHNWQTLQQIAQPAPIVSQMSYLFIRVEDTKPKSEEFLIRALFAPEHTADQAWNWRCRPIEVPLPPPDQTGYRLEQVPALLDNFLNLVDEFLDLTIEFFLPLDQLDHAVDVWETQGIIEPEQIGHRFHVTVRSVERLMPTYRSFKGDWQKKWQILQQSKGRSAAELFVSDADPDFDPAPQKWRAGKKAGLQLAQLPDQKELKRTWGALLQSGMPVGLWVRQPLTQCNSRSELNELLQCCVTQLSEQVMQKRVDACGCDPDAHIGYHLSLLWEDPNRLPETLQYEMPPK